MTEQIRGGSSAENLMTIPATAIADEWESGALS